MIKNFGDYTCLQDGRDDSRIPTKGKTVFDVDTKSALTNVPNRYAQMSENWAHRIMVGYFCFFLTWNDLGARRRPGFNLRNSEQPARPPMETRTGLHRKPVAVGVASEPPD